MSLLEARGIKKTYRTRFGGASVEALKNVNFTVEKGEYVAIMGESGSGKTTLLNIIAALDKPTEGTVIGSTEQHGPMLPLSVDCILSSGVCKELAERVDGIVAPTVCYGYKSAPLSGGGPLFPGTIDLNGYTLQNVISDVLEEFIRDGVKKFFIHNGHYENEAFIIEAVDLLSRKYPDVIFVESSWWDVMSDELIARVFDEFEYPGIELEHAGVLETSMTMYFRPDLVHMEKFVEDGVEEELPYRIYPASLINVPKTGLLTTARTSTAEKGKMIVDEVVEEYMKVIERRFK